MQTSVSGTMSPVNGRPEMAPEVAQRQLSDLALLQEPALRAASGLVRQLLALPPERHDERTRVADLIGECLNLIRVVSEANGPGTGRTAAEVDAAAVCEIAAAIVRAAHVRAASQIVVHTHAPTVGVVADRDRLLTAIVNLAARTVAELPTDGLLELTTSPVGTNIEIRIADSGVEIAPPDIPRLAAGGAVDSDRISARVAGFAPILDQGVAMRYEMRLGLRTAITLPAASGAIPAPTAPQETESVPYRAPPGAAANAVRAGERRTTAATGIHARTARQR